MSNKGEASRGPAAAGKNRPLNRRIGLRVSDHELSVLESRALRNRQSLSDYVRAQTLAPTAADAEYATRAWVDGQEMLGRLEDVNEQLQELKGMVAALLYLQRRQVPAGVFNDMRAEVQFAKAENLLGDLLPELAADLEGHRRRSEVQLEAGD